MSKVAIICASNNKNLELSREFEKELFKLNINNEIVDLVSLDLPLYTPKEEAKGVPAQVFKVKKILDKTNGFVFVSPEYNGGVPPILTNFIAWISRSGDEDWRSSFNGKSAALATYSGGGGFQVLSAMRLQLSYIGLNLIGRQVRATHREGLKISDVQKVSNLLASNL